MSRNSQSLSTLLSGFCVLVLLAAGMCAAQTAPSPDSNSNSAQPVGDSGAPSDAGALTFAPIRPELSYPRAQRQRQPAAWNRSLSQSPTHAAGKRQNLTQQPQFGGTWQAGTNYAPSPLGITGNPLLLTDGTVIVSDGGLLGNWYKLTPDITGSYVNGTWTQIATMPVINGVQYAPYANASAVLPDGRVIVLGGEYNWQGGTISYDTNLGAIYDPVANTWTPVSAPAGSSWSNIGDAMSTVLADGTFLLGSCCSVPPVDALFDATNLTWTSTGAPVGGSNGQDEQGYTLLPNGNVLTVDIFNSGVGYNSAEQYDPGSGAWGSAGNTGTRLYDICGSLEIGPAPLRPDGTVVQFGGYACGFDDTYPSATPDPTGIYDSTTGTWSAGPDVPVVDGLFFSIPDGSAAVLPNGNILFAASPWAGYAKEPPTHFFEFTTANAINQVADAPDGVSEFEISNEFNFLVLPNGQILVNVGADPQLFYTPTGSPDPSWAPVISTAPSTIYSGSTYTIAGTQLNGLSQGAYYGDDFQMATNYPIVQITNTATSHLFYARSFGFSNRSIAPGNTSSTSFVAPAIVESGPSTLVVIANGIPSAPQNVTILQPGQAVPTITSANNTSFTVGQSGSFTVTTTGTPTPSLSKSGALPLGVSFADNGNGTGTLSWVSATPVAGPYNFNILAQNVVETATQSFTLTVNPSTVQIMVGTSPAGLRFAVDGIGYTSTQTFNWNPGDMHTVVTPSPQYPSASVEQNWVNWSDGGALSHTITVPSTATTYTATFSTYYALTTAANPASGGTVSPATGFQPMGSVVPLLATPNPNYSFGSWTGNVANPGSASTTITMNAPQSVTANFVVTGTLSVTPSSLNFGTVYLNRRHKLRARVTNIGASTVTIGGVTITEGTADAAAYTFVGFCKGPLKPGKSCIVAVDLLADAVGTLTATLNIADNAPGSPQQIALTANVIDPAAQLNPTKLTFGSQKVGSITTEPVQLTNLGETDLTVGNIAFTGAAVGDYSQSNDCPAALAPTASCTVQVTFTPSAKGNRPAALLITDNMATGETKLPITGVGN